MFPQMLDYTIRTVYPHLWDRHRGAVVRAGPADSKFDMCARSLPCCMRMACCCVLPESVLGLQVVAAGTASSYREFGPLTSVRHLVLLTCRPWCSSGFGWGTSTTA